MAQTLASRRVNSGHELFETRSTNLVTANNQGLDGVDSRTPGDSAESTDPLLPSSEPVGPTQGNTSQRNGTEQSTEGPVGSDHPNPAQIAAAESESRHPIKLHKMSRIVMFGCYIIALAVALAHHSLNNYFSGKVVSSDLQQSAIRYVGNFFGHTINALLALSTSVAFTQYLFKCLKKRPLTVKALDAIYHASSSVLSLLHNCEIFTVMPDVAGLAIAIALLTIPTTVFAPGALLVVQNATLSPAVNISVNQLDIASTIYQQASYFQVSRNANGPQGPNSTVVFVEPRTILTRLSTATAASGQMLTSQPPALNASYPLNFSGPYVQCRAAFLNEMTMIKSVKNTAEERSNASGNSVEYNAYFAYVPDLSDSATWGLPNTRNTDSSRSSNQLWLFYLNNATDLTNVQTNEFSKYCPIEVYQVCTLHNAVYNITVAFENGLMNVSFNNGTGPNIGSEMDYPLPVVDIINQPDEVPNLSYAAFMWALTELLVGNMSMVSKTVPLANGTENNIPTGQIQTSIENTALLGSSDLDCYFLIDPYLTNKTGISAQRGQDIAFAKNAQLPTLISELSINITISLMNDALLAPPVAVNGTISPVKDIYHYRLDILWGAYGAAFSIALIAAILGCKAFQDNKFPMNTNFSSTVSAVRRTRLLEPRHYSIGGQTPLPHDVMGKKLLFVDHQDGGRGFEIYPTE